MRRLVAALVAVLVMAAVAGPAAADEGDDPDTSTTTSTSEPTSTTSTTGPEPPGSTTSTTMPPVPPTGPPDDPAAPVDAPPDTVPVTDVTVPPADVVDGALVAGVLRRTLEVARAEAVASAADVVSSKAQVDGLSAKLGALQRQIAKLDVAEQLAVERLAEARERFEDRIADAVVRGNSADLATFVDSGTANEVSTRNVLLTSVSEADELSVREYLAAREDVDDAIIRSVDAVAGLRRELRVARAALAEALAANAERKFQLAVFSAGSEIVIDGFVFPVGEPHDFIDSFGFPRMPGTQYSHSHQGTDIMAPFGTPLHATERGVITRIGTDVLGGQKLWLKGQSGTYYYYAHLQAYAPGLHEGQVVDAGEVVGFVGDTGNAKGGAPHLHFQVHPQGGAAVNPYPLLKVVDDLSRR